MGVRVCEKVGREIRSRESRLLVLLCAFIYLYTQAHAHALADQWFVKKNSEDEGSFMTTDMILNIIPCSRKFLRRINHHLVNNF